MANEHAGHRRRLFLRLMVSGLDSFQPHEVMEALLCYAIPARDVNGLAHRLINRFGSVDGVLSAPKEALVAVDGIGEKTARFLKDVDASMSEYIDGPTVDLPKLNELKKMAAYCYEMFSGVGRDIDCMACLSPEGHLLNLTMIGDGDRSIRTAAEAALRYRTHSVVMVRYRVGGSSAFTPDDMDFVRRLTDTMSALDITTLDHILITTDGYLSLRKNGMLRENMLRLGEELNLALHWLGG